jgi:hypothetical protein
MVKIRIEEVFDGDDEYMLVGDVYDIAKEIWMIEHLGLSQENAYNNSKIEIDSYSVGYKIKKYDFPSEYFCLEKNRCKIAQSYAITVTWITNLDNVILTIKLP